MTYTILSATYANAEHTAAICRTDEAGDVLLTQADTPADWDAMLAATTPAAYEPPSATVSALSVLAKADIWRRCTDDEASKLDAALKSQPVRLQRLYDGAQYISSGDELYTTLNAAVTQILGASRAAVILAPSD